MKEIKISKTMMKSCDEVTEILKIEEFTKDTTMLYKNIKLLAEH